jgi:hypothetical protein
VVLPALGHIEPFTHAVTAPVLSKDTQQVCAGTEQVRLPHPSVPPPPDSAAALSPGVPLSAVLLSSAGAASPVDASMGGGAAPSPAPLPDVLPLLGAPDVLPLLEPPDPEPLPEELLLGAPLDAVLSPPASPPGGTMSTSLVPPQAQRSATPPTAANIPSRAMSKPFVPGKPGPTSQSRETCSIRPSGQAIVGR